MPASPVPHHGITTDGRPFTVREAALRDAPQILAHAHAIMVEPQWNVTEPEEFQHSLAHEESWINSFSQRPHQLLLVADVGTPALPLIVGVLSFTTHPRIRMRHRGRVGIGVQAPWRGLGIGEALLQTLVAWARVEPELERVELSVFAHNTRALNLYRKVGFIEEARLPRAFKLADGTYYDDVMMVLWVK